MQLKFLNEIGCNGRRGESIREHIANLEKIIANPNNDVVPSETWNEIITPIKNKLGISWRDFAKKLAISYPGSSLFKNSISRKRLEKIAWVLNDKKLKMLAQSEVVWDRIISIEARGIEEVFDATIEGTHNFIANDIIVHNSIEQDADVVMFLYQEEDTEDLMDQNKRMIKLYIAKHRNGAIGEIDLMFRGDRVKFYNVEKTV